MKKLNKERRVFIDSIQSQIAEMNRSIDVKYNMLVKALGEELSDECEGWLFDYIYNPDWNQDLAIEMLFDKDA